MLTHVGAFALDDLLIASSNDVINNGFLDSALPPIIKGWLAEKVLKNLPKPFLSDLLTAMISDRDMAETLTYTHSSTDTLSEISIKIYKNAQMKAWHEAGASLPVNQHGKLNENLFEGDVTTFEYFDETMLAEIPMNQQVSVINKGNFSKKPDSEEYTRKRKRLLKDGGFGRKKSGLNNLPTMDENSNSDQDYSEKSPKPTKSKYNRDNSKTIKENSQTVKVDSDSSSDAGDSKIEIQCQICEKFYSCRSNLHGHMRRCHPEEWAEKMEKLKGKPRLHKRTLKVAEKDAYHDRHPCEYCDAAYTSRQGLYHHLKRWHPEKVLAGIWKVVRLFEIL